MLADDTDDEMLIGNGVKKVRVSRLMTLTSTLDDIARDTEETPTTGDSSGRKTKEVLLLSYDETDTLLKHLEEATKVLTTHYELLQFADKHPLEEDEHPPTRCDKVKTCVWKLLYKFTGSKAISATILLQLVCLVMLTVIDGVSPNLKAKHTALEAGSIVMMILQIINLIIVVMISAQILDQFQKKRVSRVLLLQYFIITILLFAGIYTATYRIDLKSWKFVEDTDSVGNPALIVEIYTRFLFYSASTATLCGAADALPKQWYNCLFVSAQMLLSFIYFTSVLSNVIIFTNKPKTRSLELKRELQVLRNNEWRRRALE